MAWMLSTAEAKPNKQKVVLYVYLHCQDCCDKIMKNIPFDKDLKNGVKDIVFDMEAQTVTVTYDANKTDVPTIQKAFAKIGKPATTQAPSLRNSSLAVAPLPSWFPFSGLCPFPRARFWQEHTRRHPTSR